MVILTALIMLLPLVSLGQIIPEIPEIFEQLNGEVAVFPPFPPTHLNCTFDIYYYIYYIYNFPIRYVDLNNSSVTCSPEIYTMVMGYNISSEKGPYLFTLDFYLREGKGRFSNATITTTGLGSENAKFFDDVSLSHPGCLFCLAKDAAMCLPQCFPENPSVCLYCILDNALQCLTPCGFPKLHLQLEQVAGNGTEILAEGGNNYCTASYTPFHGCKMDKVYCSTGQFAQNFYHAAKCCCKCCDRNGSCGVTTC